MAQSAGRRGPGHPGGGSCGRRQAAPPPRGTGRVRGQGRSLGDSSEEAPTLRSSGPLPQAGQASRVFSRSCKPRRPRAGLSAGPRARMHGHWWCPVTQYAQAEGQLRAERSGQPLLAMGSSPLGWGPHQQRAPTCQSVSDPWVSTHKPRAGWPQRAVGGQPSGNPQQEDMKALGSSRGTCP